MKYNCCTNGVLPDMTKFISLEVNAVYPFTSEESESFEDTFCEAQLGVASKKVELEGDLNPADLFYSVYGRYEDGEAEALHDESTLEQIMVVANDLSKRFSLEVIVI